MEMTLESEFYAPTVNDNGIYVDNTSYISKNGIRCPCCSRKDKVYNSRQQFATHIKTKTHVKWLQDINNNRANFFIENIKLNETITSQQQIIAKLEINLQNKILTIDYLTKMLTANQSATTSSVDLLDLDEA